MAVCLLLECLTYHQVTCILQKLPSHSWLPPELCKSLVFILSLLTGLGFPAQISCHLKKGPGNLGMKKLPWDSVPLSCSRSKVCGPNLDSGVWRIFPWPGSSGQELLHICVLEVEKIARACPGLRGLLTMTSWSLRLIVHRLARQPSHLLSTQLPALHLLTANLTVCPQVLPAVSSPPLI